ncbi:hypothetical protein D3C86_1732610 [compost metagenome]
MKTHQDRVIGSIATAEHVPAAGFFADFTIESQQALQRTVAAAFAIGIIGSGAQFGSLAFTHYTVFTVGH